MFVDESGRPENFPELPTPDEVTARFGGPLFTLKPQPSVEELTVSTVSSTTNGQTHLESASLSYALWRNPEDRSDPANLADVSDELRAQLDEAPLWPLPESLMKIREQMRYPMLWEAVRTTVPIDSADRAWRTPEFALVEHVNYVLMNRFRNERMRGEMPGELLGPATKSAVEHDVPIWVDGQQVDGIRVDTDAHVLGLGLELEDRYLTAVIARTDLPFIEPTFVTRPVRTPL
ncbi:hypothetical protein C5B95_12145 [Rathayibacter sp. AY1A7]|nr:hypothetical protein C5B95_12145 [Rathayibacter sp. AY1A7]